MSKPPKPQSTRREIGQVTRAINLAFRVSGLREQYDAVQGLMRLISMVTRALVALQMAWRALKVTMGPEGWAALGLGEILQLGIAGLTTVSIAQDSGVVFG